MKPNTVTSTAMKIHTPVISHRASLSLLSWQRQGSKREQTQARAPEAWEGDWHTITSAIFYCLKQITRPARLKTQGNAFHFLTGRNVKSLCRGDKYKKKGRTGAISATNKPQFVNRKLSLQLLFHEMLLVSKNSIIPK